MVKDIRVTYRKRHSYNTKSNKIRVVKTPGGRHVAQYVAKKAMPVKCGLTGKALLGVRLYSTALIAAISDTQLLCRLPACALLSTPA